MHYLYKITNLVNNKIYIGQTVQPNKRWWQHRFEAANPTKVIHYAINKYGAHNFVFEVIAMSKTKNDANIIEIELIRQYQSHVSTGLGYNNAIGGNSNSGYHHSEETRRKISKANKGQKQTPEQKKLLFEGLAKWVEENGPPHKGKKHTKESKQKMSESHKGYSAWNKGLIDCFSEETRQKMANAKRGKKASEETKRKMSISRTKNRKCSIEDCDNPHDAKGYCSKHYYQYIDREQVKKRKKRYYERHKR